MTTSFGTNEGNHTNFSDSPEYVFRFVIIGDSGIGKSSIIHHFIHNKCKYIHITD